MALVAGRDGGVRDTQDPDDWQRVMVRSDETPRITTEQLEIFRQSMPSAMFEQEFECEWLDTEGSLFSQEDIESALALGEDVEALEIGDEW
jgi:hypothetical protein